jgi:hypothetical protein
MLKRNANATQKAVTTSQLIDFPNYGNNCFLINAL